MRIERINENSIRCILTSFDLSVRNLNIRELAYGTEKAKKLFSEMMAKANSEVGFDAENTPIMIEAIPMSSDSIQLVITKVEDPEELDTRFSRFSHMQSNSSGTEEWLKKLTSELLEGADGLLSQMRKAGVSGQQKAQTSGTAAGKTADAASAKQVEAANGSDDPFRAYAFENLDRVIAAVKAAPFFKGYSTLYKRTGDARPYVLVVLRADTQAEDFAKTCNIIAEYGKKMKTTASSLAYFNEHYSPICKDRAVQKLGSI